MSEYDLYSGIICEATRLGHRLFRNNVGRAKYKSASGDNYTVPYGVAGAGGSDILGWTIRERRQVSSLSFYNEADRAICERPWAEATFTACVFTAIEVKPPGWKPPREGTKSYKHYEEQKRFIDAVIAAGGIAGFVRSVAEYRALIGAQT